MSHLAPDVRKLIHLVRTPHSNNLAHIEKVLNFIYDHPAREQQAKLLEALFRFWRLPKRNEEAIGDEPSFSKEEIEKAARRLAEMLEEGIFELCEPFHEDQRPIKVAAEVQSQLKTINKEGVVLGVTYLAFLLKTDHIPYLRPDKRKLENLGETDDVLTAISQEPELFSELQYICLQHGQQEASVWLARTLADCTDEIVRKSLILYAFFLYKEKGKKSGEEYIIGASILASLVESLINPPPPPPGPSTN